MVNIYLDTEFNGFGGVLMSMGLLPDDGSTPWYQEIKLPEGTVIDPWVKENVVPLFTKNRKLDYSEFKNYFQNYIRKYKNATIICDWHQDAIFFLELLRGVNYAHSLNYPCNIALIKPFPDPPISRHHALEDAKLLMEWCRTHY